VVVESPEYLLVFEYYLYPLYIVRINNLKNLINRLKMAGHVTGSCQFIQKRHRYHQDLENNRAKQMQQHKKNLDNNRARKHR